ncbi:MAG: PcfJ domain-containing protein [Bacteroidales bacterium]|nr:PcfJ domain-containing protein [Bacteroidales bacterium]
MSIICFCGKGTACVGLGQCAIADGCTNKQHHCVFECGYYKRPQTLILHAVIDGEPIETLEVDLTSLAVVQCRSKFNGKSAFHDRIMELMTSNLHEVARRIHKQTEPIAITA